MANIPMNSVPQPYMAPVYGPGPAYLMSGEEQKKSMLPLLLVGGALVVVAVIVIAVIAKKKASAASTTGGNTSSGSTNSGSGSTNSGSSSAPHDLVNGKLYYLQQQSAGMQYRWVNGGSLYECLNSLVPSPTSSFPSANVPYAQMQISVASNYAVMIKPNPSLSSNPGYIQTSITGQNCSSCACFGTTDSNSVLTVKKTSSGAYTIQNPQGMYMTASSSTLNNTPCFSSSTPVTGSYWNFVAV